MNQNVRLSYPLNHSDLGSMAEDCDRMCSLHISRPAGEGPTQAIYSTGPSVSGTQGLT